MPAAVHPAQNPPSAPPGNASARRFALPRPALPPGLRTAAAAWQGAAALCGLVLAAGRIGAAAPFGLALVLGCTPGYALAAAAGAVAGALLFQPVDLALKLIGALLAGLVARLLRRGPAWMPLATALTVLAAEQTAASLWLGFDAAQWLPILTTGAVAAAAAAGIRALPIHSPRGACLWLAMLAVCAQRLAPLGLACGLALAAAACLCAACHGTLAQAAVLGIVLAAAVTVTDPALGWAALALALGTLAAAVLGRGARGRAAAELALVCVVCSAQAPGPAAAWRALGGIGLGALAFVLVPDGLWRELFPAGEAPAAAPAPPAANGALSQRLAGVAAALADVADTVNAVCERQLPHRGESFDFVVEYTARRLCCNCPQRERCWLHSYSAIVDALYHLKPPLESRGRAQIEDLCGILTGCRRPGELCLCVTHGYRLWRSRRQSLAQATVLRSALTGQYTAMAGALARLAEQLRQAGLPDAKRQAKAMQLFAGLGLEALECTVSTDLYGRMTATVTVPRAAFAPDELAALAAELGRGCRRDFALPEVSSRHAVTTLTFAERPLYRAVFGAANRPADAQSVSGDAWEQFCDGSGRAQMLLCDGMGTGRPAAVDGQMAARLTAQLLRAGLTADSAARLVNAALGLKNSDQESGATLDLVTVDLYTGRAASYKAGAAPSFLLRGGAARALDGGTGLPIGVLDDVVGQPGACTLEAEDVLVLVSDGVLADGSEWLLQQLTLCARLGHSPAQLAQAVVDGAAKRPGAGRDDCTAIALQLARA